MYNYDTTLNANNSISANAMKNDYGISSFVPEGSTDYLYLEAFLALDTLLEQDDVREKYNASMVFDEEGEEAATEQEKYIECADNHLQASNKTIEKLDAILSPLKQDLEERLSAGKAQLPENINKKFVEIHQLKRSIEGHNKATRYALDMADRAKSKATAAFDQRDKLLSAIPEVLDALTTLELIRGQVSNEVISITELNAYH